MEAISAIITIATTYQGVIGVPLYCSTPGSPLLYDTSLPPWIALPPGTFECGDLVYLRFPNGDTLMARALDAGPFASYCVEQPDGSCPGIGVDVPAHLWPMGSDTSAWVEMYLIGERARESATGND